MARELPELEPALEEAFRLHALRWEGRPDGSGFGTPVGMEFHRAALKRLAAIDVARIVTLRLDGRAIAFHYWFALEGCMYVHRLAFDPELARWSPGLVNTLDAIESAADEGMTRVEYLGGGERYKLELADGLSPLYHGFGLSSGVRGRAYAAAHVATIKARLRLKQFAAPAQASTSRTWRPRDGSLSAGSTLAAESFRHAVGGEAAAVDEARDRAEAALGREADEQQVRVARAEVTVEHGPAVAHRDGVPDRGGEEREPVEPEAEAGGDDDSGRLAPGAVAEAAAGGRRRSARAAGRRCPR